jgi:hypothetical protein
MIYLLTNKKGATEHVFAENVKQARSRARISNARGKKSDLDVSKVPCHCDNHYQNYKDCGYGESYAARYAVAWVRGEPWCAVCIAKIGAPLEDRVAELERRVQQLEDGD